MALSGNRVAVDVIREGDGCHTGVGWPLIIYGWWPYRKSSKYDDRDRDYRPAATGKGVTRIDSQPKKQERCKDKFFSTGFRRGMALPTSLRFLNFRF